MSLIEELSPYYQCVATKTYDVLPPTNECNNVVVFHDDNEKIVKSGLLKHDGNLYYTVTLSIYVRVQESYGVARIKQEMSDFYNRLLEIKSECREVGNYRLVLVTDNPVINKVGYDEENNIHYTMEVEIKYKQIRGA